MRRNRSKEPLSYSLDDNDLFFYFKAYVDELATLTVREELSKSLRAEVIAIDTNSIAGTVHVGDYGYSAELYDLKTSAHSHSRKPTDTEVVPYYFLAYLPRRSPMGVVLLQGRSGVSVHEGFLKPFARFTRERRKGYRVEESQLVPKSLVEHFRRGGSLERIRFTRFCRLSDIADNYPDPHIQQVEGKAETVFTPNSDYKGQLMSKIVGFFDDEDNAFEVFKIQDQQYDSVKVELDVSGNIKTFDLSDVMKIRANMDISDDVEIGDDGHPLFDSIHSVATRHMGTLERQVWMEYDNV